MVPVTAVLLLVGGLVPARDVVPAPPIIGELSVLIVEQGDTLLDIARRYDLGYVEVVAANPGIDPWVPGKGAVITLPAAHIPPPVPQDGLVINLGDMRLWWYRPGDTSPGSFPIGIGETGRQMAVGTKTQIIRKRVNPTWVVPKSILAERPDLPPVVPPGPDNPLGAFSLDLAVDSYRIHGTDKPDGVGRRVSHGCIRLYPEDIARLFAQVPIGTKVTVVDRPILLAWKDGELYLSVHPSQAQDDQIENGEPVTPEELPELPELVGRAAGGQIDRIDWPTVNRVAAAHRGIPQRITRPPPIPLFFR